MSPVVQSRGNAGERFKLEWAEKGGAEKKGFDRSGGMSEKWESVGQRSSVG